MTNPTSAHGRDWMDWHTAYQDPESALSRRLATVARAVREAVDERPTGMVRLLSMCAGQGHDVVAGLGDHPRRDEVRGVLVELDPGNAELARRSLAEAGLDGLSVVEGDAGTTASYRPAVPADVVLVCGVFGNISDDDVRGTIATLPRLCAPGATVIWTRHRRAPDLVPRVRSWFAESGFEEQSHDAPPDVIYAVGVHRLRSTPPPFDPDRQMFTFRR